MKISLTVAAACLICLLHIVIVYGQDSAPASKPFIIKKPAASKPVASQPSTAKASEDLQKMVSEISGQVEEIRGWEYKKAVPAEVLTDAQVKAHMTDEIEAELKEGEFEQVQAFMKLTGLIPPDCDIMHTYKNFVADQAGGFYSSKTGKYYMPLRIYEEYSRTYKGIITAHELTHALDDQYFGLEKIAKSREETEDWSLTWRSVAEGSATISMTQYVTELSRSGKLDMGEMLQMAAKEQKETAKLSKLPTYFMSLVMVYPAGTNFLLKGKNIQMVILASPQDLKNLGDTLLALAKKPPLSTEQILHPEKYWDKDKFDEPVTVADDGMERIFTKMEFKSVYKSTIGEMLCSILTRRDKFDTSILSSAARCTSRAASGWGGDRFYLLLPASTPGSVPASGSAEGGFTGVWITLWDTPKDVGEFQEGYEKYRPLKNRQSFPLGDRGMVYCFGLTDQQVEKLKTALAANPPAFTQFGKAWTTNAPATQIHTQPTSGPANPASPAANVGESVAPANETEK